MKRTKPIVHIDKSNLVAKVSDFAPDSDPVDFDNVSFKI